MSQTARFRGKKENKDGQTSKGNAQNLESEKVVTKSKTWSLIKYILKLVIIIPVVLYLLAVTLIYTSSFVREQAIFLNYANNPFVNFSTPEAYGAKGAINFHINGPAGKLGTWYIPAKEIPNTNLGDGQPIFLYLHGNAFNRAEPHRVALYQVLSKLSFHVVTFDYRGFADSEGHPSEEGLIEDGLTVWKWIKRRSKKAPVYIWGHSLGSGVATGVAERLTQMRAPPKGLILEAAFNSVYDAGLDHSLAKPFKFLPYFHEVVMESFKGVFETDKRLGNVNCPVLMLHDHDDDIIPFKYGKKLQVYATKQRRAKGFPEIELLEFHDKLGHNWIITSKLIPGLLRDFMKKV